MSREELFFEAATPEDAERQSVAQFIMSRERQIRAIARGRLSQGTRSVFDSEDVFSSVLRRVDNLARRGKLRLGCEAELWGFIKVIATNTAISKTRLIECSRNWLTEEPDYAYYLVQALNACEDDDEANWVIYRMAASLERADRQLFFLRLRGAGHKAIAGVLRIDEEAARQRWSRVCRGLRERFGGTTP
jgi:hypothetical protein